MIRHFLAILLKNCLQMPGHTNKLLLTGIKTSDPPQAMALRVPVNTPRIKRVVISK